jgi:hypothetical protein
MRSPRTTAVVSGLLVGVLLLLGAVEAAADGYTVTIKNSTNKEFKLQCAYKIKQGVQGFVWAYDDFTLAAWSGSGSYPQYTCHAKNVAPVSNYCPSDVGGWTTGDNVNTTRQCMSGVVGTGSDCPAPGYVCENSTWVLTSYANQYQYVKQ